MRLMHLMCLMHRMHHHHHRPCIATWAIHHLALAVAHGAPKFACLALKPALKEISSPEERGKVMATAWEKFAPVDVAAHVVFTATWLHGRAVIKSCPHRSFCTERLVTIKDMLVGGALVTGLANAIAGKIMARKFPQGVPIDANGDLAPNAPKEAAKFVRFFRIVGPINQAFVAGSIAIGPALTFSILRTARHPWLTRLLGI